MTRNTILFTGKDQIEFIEEPIRAPAAGEILIQTTRTLISTGTETIALSRKFSLGTHWDKWVKYPFRTGYSYAGRVLEIGEGVTEFTPGDRVMARETHTSIGLVPAAYAVRIPDNVSDDDATWCALALVAQVGIRAARHTMGDTAVVIGLGQVGQLVVQYLNLMGASQIIGIDPAPKRLEMAKSHGATATLNLPAAEALPKVKELTQGRGANVVYDVTGHAAVFASALSLAADHGKVIVLGDTGSPELQHLTPDVIRRGLHIIGAHGSHAPLDANSGVEWDAQKVSSLFMTFVERGQMRVSDLVTDRFRPQNAAEAYGLLQRERDRVMGVMFEWD